MRWSATISAPLMPGPSAAGALGDERLEARPAGRRRGWSRSRRPRAGGDEAVGEVRGERRERPADGRAPRSVRAAAASSAARTPARDGAGEDAVAGGAGGLGRAVGAAGLGRLRQGDEQRGLGGGQPARLLAEPGEARGADALEVAAVGGEGEVEARGSRPCRAGARAPGRRGSGGACRRAVPVGPSSSRRATCMVSVEPPETMRPWRSDWSGGAGERERIDAGVAAEAAVLEGDELREVAAVDRGERRPAGASGRRRRCRRERSAPSRSRRRCRGRGREVGGRTVASIQRSTARTAPAARASAAASSGRGPPRRSWPSRTVHACRRRCGRGRPGGTCPRRWPPGGGSVPGETARTM